MRGLARTWSAAGSSLSGVEVVIERLSRTR